MRLIDADALSKDLEKRWNVNDDQDFCNKEVWHALEEAPTIEPSGDIISRQDAIKRFGEDGTWLERQGVTALTMVEAKQRAVDILEQLPSAETPTISQKHQLSEETSTNTSTNTSTDLISRESVLAEFRDGRDVYDIMESIEQLPSAPDSRQRGEWVRLEREENVHDLHGVPTWGVNYMCDKCGFITTAIQDHFGQYRWCPSCGADMRGEEE